MAYITLEEAKAQVVCEHSEDDDYLLTLIDVAEASLAGSSGINRPLSEVLEEGELPPPLKHAAKLLIGTLYRDREGSYEGGRVVVLPYTIAHLILPYRLEK